MNKPNSKKHNFEISSWATPTEEDIKRYKWLSAEQQHIALGRQLDKAAKSGVSIRKPADILKAMLSRNQR